MAKECMVQREKRRAKLAKGARPTRTEKKKIISSVESTPEQKSKAVGDLSRRKRDESPCRGVNRCNVCDRPRGVYRKFKLCRICLRQMAMKGLIPGLKKASW